MTKRSRPATVAQRKEAGGAMANYRDKLEAARLRNQTLEAQLTEQKAAVAARDAELEELRAALGRRGAEVPDDEGGPGDAKKQHPKQLAGRVAFLLGIVIAVAIVIFVATRSPTGTLSVRVTEGDKPVGLAEIYVDGRKACDLSPCTLEEVASGLHTIRVVAGSGTEGQTVHVDQGGKHEVVVRLAAREPPKPKPEPEATLELRSPVKDVRVFVNGEHAGKLPVVLAGVKPGTVTLRFEGTDEYREVEKIILLQPGQTFVLEDIRLPRRIVKVTFELVTRDAKVELIGEGDEPGARETIGLRFRGGKFTEPLDTSKRWTVRATKKGHARFEQKLSFDDGEPGQDVRIELPKAKATTAAPTSTTTTTSRRFDAP